jgi:hypothetical protein
VYTGSAVNRLTLVRCGDDVGGNGATSLASAVAFDAAAGVPYWVQVGGFTNSPLGSAGSLVVDFDATPMSGGAGQFVLDSFTEGATADLTAHTPEAGGPWVEHPAWPSGLTSVGPAGRTYFNNSAQSILNAAGQPASPDYDVAADLYVASLTGTAGVIARVDPAVSTMYLGQYTTGSQRWELARLNGGAKTVLGTFTQALTVGETHNVRLEARGSSLKLYVDGVQRIAATDGTIGAAGRAGLEGCTCSTSYGPVTGLQFDNFAAQDAGASTPPSQTATPGIATPTPTSTSTASPTPTPSPTP